MKKVMKTTNDRRAWGKQRWLAALLLLASCAVPSKAQDIFGKTDRTGVDRIRLAAADFKPLSGDPNTTAVVRTFDAVLSADLEAAGIFDLVSKLQQPKSTPGFPAEINLGQWSAPPANAASVAFGNLTIQSGRLVVNGFLDAGEPPQYPQLFAQECNAPARDDSARPIAHRFADEIIQRLGGGAAGIAETKIYYVRQQNGNKEIWEMDYDGANQHAITSLGTVSISPRISPDNSRIAFSSLTREGFQIRMYSLLLGRVVNFPSAEGTNVSPAWSPSGAQLAFSSSRTGDPDIWVSDPDGRTSHKITSFRGPDVSPTWNPKTGAQIAWISGRTGLPQLYVMDADGAGIQRMTDGGYATSVSWSPNGQFLAFAWDRKYGPGAPGGQDIYVMEVASKRWVQLTNGIGRCDFPTWSPDGRHIAYANAQGGGGQHTRIMTMLVDGSNIRALTSAGADMPNWSWK